LEGTDENPQERGIGGEMGKREGLDEGGKKPRLINEGGIKV